MNQPLLEEEKPQKKVYIAELQVGHKVKSKFIVSRLSLRDYDRGKFLFLRLGDRTGKINAIIWNNAEEVSKQIKEGVIVEVEGKVNSYRNELQVTIKTIRHLQDYSDINPHDFLPVSSVPLEQMIDEYEEVTSSVEDVDYQALLTSFREDTLLWGKFIVAPGAKLWHHPHIHGLLEHTLSVIKLCKLIAPFYPHVNSDLLVTGGVFHDVGKIDEFTFDYHIDYSTDGRLLGHIYIGSSIVERLIVKIPDFPENKRRELLHLILSHHGEVERSPVLPMTLESCLLHHIENMDAQMAALGREMNKVRDEKKEWTGYVNLIQRHLYLGDSNSLIEEESPDS